jgi:hypothetical protein
MSAFAVAGVWSATAGDAQMLMPGQTRTYDLGNQGALYRFTVDAGAGRRFGCTAAVLPRRSFAAGIVQQQAHQGALTAVQDVARRTHATVAINGGFFNGAFSPDGLLMVGGKTVGEKRADWRGYLVVDDDGNASVTDAPHLSKAAFAVQGHPVIVDPDNKIGIERDDNQRARRSVIAQSGDVIIAMVTTPVSLFSLAYALIEQPDRFYVSKIDAALNLSGAATTSFYAKTADGSEITEPAYWPNRDVIVFAPRVV